VGEDRGNPIGGSIRGKYCVNMYVKKNMRPVETISGLGEGIKENGGGGVYSYDVFGML
jgi:hypothetical protein